MKECCVHEGGGGKEKLWTNLDEIWWAGWVCDQEEMIQFCLRCESGYKNYLIFKVILHH